MRPYLNTACLRTSRFRNDCADTAFSRRRSDHTFPFPTLYSLEQSWQEKTVPKVPSRAPKGYTTVRAAGNGRHVSHAQDISAPARRQAEHAQRPAFYIRGSGGGGAAARESRGSFLSVSGRLGAGDCWRGAWKLALVPLRLLSRSRPLGSSLTPGELSLPPRCRPISRGRKMPSSAPTVSRLRVAPRRACPRPGSS